MSISDSERAIDQATRSWRQGDVSFDADLEFVHLADLSKPHSPASIQVTENLKDKSGTVIPRFTPVLDKIAGVVMLSQTCDIVRGCRDRPFIEISPLVEVSDDWVEQIRCLKRPAFAYVPAAANQNLVADLDRMMTVEKALVADWTHTRGWETIDELRKFAEALARKWNRFAFPDDFVLASRKLMKRIVSRHNKTADEGAHLRALHEIRVNATPCWQASTVQLSWWFIKAENPASIVVDWQKFTEQWLDLFNWKERFHLAQSITCRLENMTARDYVESARLDFDRLSIS